MNVKIVSGIMVTLLLTSTFILSFHIQPVNAEPTTRTVDDDFLDYPNADFNNIQDAVDAASSGDTILVYSGTYVENIKVNKSHLTIRSASGAITTIVQASNPNGHVFSVTKDYVNITGYTIKGATSVYPFNAAGIHINKSSHCYISENNISNNTLGIGLSYSSNNTLIDNIANLNYYGIYLFSSSNNTLSGNTMSNNGLSVSGYWYGGYSDFIQKIDTSNIINGKPIYYWINRKTYDFWTIESS